MRKRLALLLVGSMVLVAMYFFYEQTKDDLRPVPDDSELEETPVEPEPEQNNDATAETIIDDIITSAKEGKAIKSPFIAGISEIDEVKKEWGESVESTSIATGVYEEYPNQHTTIGHKGKLLFDIRSDHPDLHAIHIEDIKKWNGEPDEVKFYKDKSHNQIILIYHVTSSYDLKWILPNPTDSQPNPVVDHVSVYTEIKEEAQKPETIPRIIGKMSLDEKIGQLMFVGIDESEFTKKTKEVINRYKAGGIIFYPGNLVNPKQTVQLLNQMKVENENNTIPIFLGVDQEGGRISRLPGNLITLPTNETIGEINNPTYSYEIGTLLGKELNEFGFNMDFAPVMDVNSNLNNPIIGDRSFGNDPNLVSELGIQTMKGIQSENVISVIKHFPGHGDTSVDSHLDLPIVNKNLNELEQLELVPFKNAITSGADVIMVAHILLPKLDSKYPATMSKTIISDLLRDKLQFNGVVITDDLTMKAITNQYDIGDAAVQSVKAGSDILLVAHDYTNITHTFHALKAAVESGEISEKRIDESLNRIIQLKQKYNITNQKVDEVNINKLNQDIDQAVNRSY